MGATVVRALCRSQRADAMTRIFVMRAPVARGKARSLEGRSFYCCVVVRGSHRTCARRFAMNLACAVSARAAGGAMAMPPTQPAAETQNRPLSAQKPIVCRAWSGVTVRRLLHLEIKTKPVAHVIRQLSSGANVWRAKSTHFGQFRQRSLLFPQRARRVTLSAAAPHLGGYVPRGGAEGAPDVQRVV